MIRDLIGSHRAARRLTSSPWGLAAAGWLAATLLGCASNPAAVTQGTANGTGCAPQDLVVFNYDKKARTWLAACQSRVFVCSPGRQSASCAEQNPESIDPALMERIEVLSQVPSPQRDLFVNYDVSSQDWDGFAKTVATVARLRPGQLKDVEDPRRLYTEFSPDFDVALNQCLGPDGVARVDVSSSGGLTVAPAKPCLMALRSSPELGVLRPHARQSFYLGAGVRAVEPIARPSAAPPEPEEPEVSPLELAVRDWLDGSSADILSCTQTERATLTVQVDPEGTAAVSLGEDFSGSAAEGCVRSALSERQFEGGPADVVHLVHPRPVAAPEDATGTEGADAAPAPAGQPAPTLR